MKPLKEVKIANLPNLNLEHISTESFHWPESSLKKEQAYTRTFAAFCSWLIIFVASFNPNSLLLIPVSVWANRAAKLARYCIPQRSDGNFQPWWVQHTPDLTCRPSNPATIRHTYIMKDSIWIHCIAVRNGSLRSMKSSKFKHWTLFSSNLISIP